MKHFARRIMNFGHLYHARSIPRQPVLKCKGILKKEYFIIGESLLISKKQIFLLRTTVIIIQIYGYV